LIHLYVKTHNVTGLKYFGKTETKDPMKYLGSGKYWLRHLKAHGTDITTEIVASFEDREDASQYAIQFSKEHNIVESKEWANLMYETVKDGVFGYSHTEDTKRRFSETSKNRWNDPEFREKMSVKHKENWSREEGLIRKQEQSQRLSGKLRPDHSERMKGRKHTEEQKQKMRKPKPPGHGANVSAATKGVPKSDSHKKSLSEARNGKPSTTRKINPVSDHVGIIYENPRRMEMAYGLAKGFFSDIDKPIRYSSVYEKLGIPYTDENRVKTKRELGFRFQEVLI
jgi:hypothetical protein